MHPLSRKVNFPARTRNKNLPVILLCFRSHFSTSYKMHLPDAHMSQYILIIFIIGWSQISFYFFISMHLLRERERERDLQFLFNGSNTLFNINFCRFSLCYKRSYFCTGFNLCQENWISLTCLDATPFSRERI